VNKIKSQNKQSIPELLKKARNLEIERVGEIAAVASSGKKNSLKAKALRKEVARIKTQVSNQLMNITPKE